MTHSWHSLDLEKVLSLLNIDIKIGVLAQDVEQRRREYGKNTLSKKKNISPFKLFLLQFNQPLVYILLVATVVTAFLNEWVDSSVIFGVLLVNALL